MTTFERLTHVQSQFWMRAFSFPCRLRTLFCVSQNHRRSTKLAGRTKSSQKLPARWPSGSGKRGTMVTFNLKHFAWAPADPHKVTVVGPSTFLKQLAVFSSRRYQRKSRTSISPDSLSVGATHSRALAPGFTANAGKSRATGAGICANLACKPVLISKRFTGIMAGVA